MNSHFYKHIMPQPIGKCKPFFVELHSFSLRAGPIPEKRAKKSAKEGPEPLFGRFCQRFSQPSRADRAAS